jgi:hypothetical protein
MLAVAALNITQVGEFGVLIVRGSERDLEADVGLEQPIEAIPVPKRHHWSGVQVIGVAPHRKGSLAPDVYVVVVYILRPQQWGAAKPAHAQAVQNLHVMRGLDAKSCLSRLHFVLGSDNVDNGSRPLAVESLQRHRRDSIFC